MKTIQQTLAQHIKEAMLAKDKERLSILRVVVGEFNRVGKEVTDDEARKIIKKMVENAKEVDNTIEAGILSSYLPKQLSTDELENIVSATVQMKGYSSMSDMGQLMKHLSENYHGRYDGKVAAQIVRYCLK